MKNKQDLINYVSSEDRVCPMPKKWAAIFKIICDDLPPNKLNPLILAAWYEASDSEKLDRLIEQIEFAFSLKNEKSEKFAEAIYALDDSDWIKRD
jgi:hypothetical protein